MAFRRNKGLFRAGQGPVSVTPSLSAVITSLSPTGYWKMQDTSGTTAGDSSGNGRNGTYVGSPILGGTAGPDGRNYPTFTGSMTVPDNDAFSINTSGNGFSLFVIFKSTDSTAISRTVASKGATNNHEWELIYTGSTGGLIFYTLASNSALIRSGTITLPVSTSLWRAVLITKTNAAAVPVMYFNGTTPSVTSGGTGSGTYTNGTAQVSFAGSSNNGAQYAGSEAHVATFSSALSASDAGRIMAAADAENWF